MTDALPALDDLLRRTAAEIRRCRATVIRLEETVHGLVDAGAAAGPLHELQAIDLLDQRLHDLALWTERLAASALGCRAGHSASDLARPLRLAEMRRALGGAAGAETAATGQPEVF